MVIAPLFLVSDSVLIRLAEIPSEFAPTVTTDPGAASAANGGRRLLTSEEFTFQKTGPQVLSSAVRQIKWLDPLAWSLHTLPAGVGYAAFALKTTRPL